MKKKMVPRFEGIMTGIFILLFINAIYKLTTGFLNLFSFIIFIIFSLLILMIVWKINPKIGLLKRFDTKKIRTTLIIITIVSFWCLLNLTTALTKLGFVIEPKLISTTFTIINIILIIVMFLTFNKNYD